MRAGAAARQRKSRETRKHAASTTRSLLAASTGSDSAKTRLEEHLKAYRSALEGTGAESAEDQREILLALLVENIRSSAGTPDLVAQELLSGINSAWSRSVPANPRELDDKIYAATNYQRARPSGGGRPRIS